MKTILIISGGTEAIPGIILAKEMGLFVLVSDGDRTAPGFEYANEKIIASTYDAKITTQKAKQYHENIRKIDGVISISADVPLTVSTVANELCLPGISLESSMLAANKIKMKDQFVKNNILTPAYKFLQTISDFKNIINEWDYPLVIKPVDSRGARGVIRLTADTDINWAWQHALKNSPSKSVIIEKYLDGIQLSTESMIIDGKCYTCGYSDRNYEYLELYSPYIIENGSDMPTILTEEEKRDINEIIELGAKAMGIYNGTVKGDIVMHNGKPTIIELAARLSGGYFSTNMIPLSTGVNFVGTAIKMALGEKVYPEDVIPKYNKNICQRYFFPRDGIIKDIHGVENLTNNPTIKYFKINVKLGQNVSSPTDHTLRGGMVITEGNTRKRAESEAKNAIDNIVFSYK
jgi:biotin carboxylase